MIHKQTWKHKKRGKCGGFHLEIAENIVSVVVYGFSRSGSAVSTATIWLILHLIAEREESLPRFRKFWH